MKEGIHPNYPAARIACACGNTFITRSTRGDMSVDVCAACHPFYTGTQKLMDAAGRVDRFRKRYGTPSAKAPAATTPAKGAAASKSGKAGAEPAGAATSDASLAKAGADTAEVS